MVSFADRIGVVCHSTFDGVWPKTTQYDEVVLAAVLNSPLANAFVATREGNRDVTAEVLRLIPVPRFSGPAIDQIHDLVGRYEVSINTLMIHSPEDPERLLKRIDAVVMGAYKMPPRLERSVLDYFNDNDRKVGHPFRNYFPATLDVFLHLSEYLDERFARTTVGSLLKKADRQ